MSEHLTRAREHLEAASRALPVRPSLTEWNQQRAIWRIILHLEQAETTSPPATESPTTDSQWDAVEAESTPQTTQASSRLPRQGTGSGPAERVCLSQHPMGVISSPPGWIRAPAADPTTSTSQKQASPSSAEDHATTSEDSGSKSSPTPDLSEDETQAEPDLAWHLNSLEARLAAAEQRAEEHAKWANDANQRSLVYERRAETAETRLAEVEAERDRWKALAVKRDLDLMQVDDALRGNSLPEEPYENADRIRELRTKLETAEQEAWHCSLVLTYYAGILSSAGLLTDEVLNWQPDRAALEAIKEGSD